MWAHAHAGSEIRSWGIVIPEGTWGNWGGASCACLCFTKYVSLQVFLRRLLKSIQATARYFVSIRGSSDSSSHKFAVNISCRNLSVALCRTLMVLTPTFCSSGKNTNIYGSEQAGVNGSDENMRHDARVCVCVCLCKRVRT